MTGVQRATANSRRARYAEWTGRLDNFPEQWLDRLTVIDDGLLRVQTKRGPITTARGSYVLEGQRGIYPAPKGVAEYNYDLGSDGWATRRPTEIEFVEWSGQFADLPAPWRSKGNFSLNDWGHLIVQALEGRLRVELSDRIIHGPFGEFYPSSVSTFLRNYSVNTAVTA